MLCYIFLNILIPANLSIPQIKNLEELKKLGFGRYYTIEYKHNGQKIKEHNVFGGVGRIATDGGDGGCGAPGNYPGKSFIFGFENANNFAVFNDSMSN